MGTPTISTMVPCHNHGRYLPRTLLSICEQSPPPLECVVYDDCSTDDTPEVIELFERRHSFLRCVRYPAKAKDWLAELWQRTREVKGDYVNVVAADDYLLDGFYEAAASAMKHWPSVGIIFGDWVLVDSDGQGIGLAASGFIGESYCAPRSDAMGRQLCKELFYEGQQAALCRADILCELAGRAVHEMGPWNDSMAMSVVAWRYGAVYLGKVSACARQTGKNYNDRCVADESMSASHFRASLDFLRREVDAGDLPLEIGAALIGKVFRRMTPPVQRVIWDEYQAFIGPFGGSSSPRSA